MAPLLHSKATLLVGLVASPLGCSAITHLRGVQPGDAKSTSSAYSFEDYLNNFGRSYEPNEYKRREHMFFLSLAEVDAANAKNTKEGRLWKAGVHPFMDWTPAERATLNGYKPGSRRGRGHGGVISLLHSSSREDSARAAANATDFRRRRLSTFEPGSTGGILDKSVGPPIRDQGNCGSCWAISAVEAVEAQLMRNGGSSPRLSAQALVDCVPNPQHCGGTGGCDGATGELAYAFMRDSGLPLEEEQPYHGKTQQCSYDGSASGAHVHVASWEQLPSNRAKPLMQALVEHGPVVVAVDGNDWFSYESGIFDGCKKDAILGHAVLAKGYGEEAGNKFWLIQNSWSAQWGEQGHIRLLRHDDEEAWCGVDDKPKEGVGCDGGPEKINVCGSCGLLYDPIVPTGVQLSSGSALLEDGSALASARGGNYVDQMRDVMSPP